MSTSRLAIKYQALTGLRYVDVVNPAEGYSTAALAAHAPVAMTQPSYDITALFNGLQPVIATLSPEEINTFTTNAEAYLSGDGSGLAPMLHSIHKLAEFVSDRQHVVATLMRNPSEVADSIGGHSKDMVRILGWVNRPLDGALKAIDEFRKSKLFGPDFTDTVLRLLANAGFPPVVNAARPFRLQPPPASPENLLPSDIDAALDRAFTNIDEYIDAFKLVPVAWENIPEPPEARTPLPCSRGRFELPAPMDIFVNGQRVLLGVAMLLRQSARTSAPSIPQLRGLAIVTSARHGSATCSRSCRAEPSKYSILSATPTESENDLVGHTLVGARDGRRHHQRGCQRRVSAQSNDSLTNHG